MHEWNLQGATARLTRRIFLLKIKNLIILIYLARERGLSSILLFSTLRSSSASQNRPVQFKFNPDTIFFCCYLLHIAILQRYLLYHLKIETRKRKQ
ncbi:MAG: hypothetical protein ACI90V_010820 [Bacillariaceae sp.]|jgi:hypothetical protein